MEDVVDVFKNVTYMVIVFAFLQRAMPQGRNKAFIKYFAGFIIVISIVGPLMNMITNIDENDLARQMSEWISGEENLLDEKSADRLIKENDDLACDLAKRYYENGSKEQ